MLTLSTSSSVCNIQPRSQFSAIFIACKTFSNTHNRNYRPRNQLSVLVNINGITQGSTKWVLRNNNPSVVVSSPSSTESDINSAASIVRKFYEGVNSQDLGSVEPLIAENCVYEDLIFPQPFVGRKAIIEFLRKFTDSVSTELKFAIDDISEADTSAVGVTWHLEWQGKTFPFSKGCSFYRVEVINGQRQIIYGRDSVEPAIKPGETALVAIRGVAWLLKQFPQLAQRL